MILYVSRAILPLEMLADLDQNLQVNCSGRNYSLDSTCRQVSRQIRERICVIFSVQPVIESVLGDYAEIWEASVLSVKPISAHKLSG